MSLQARESYPIPAETARVARAIFPKGNLVMRLSDELGMIFHDQDCADLFPFKANQLKVPRDWRSSRCCHSWKVSPQ